MSHRCDRFLLRRRHVIMTSLVGLVTSLAVLMRPLSACCSVSSPCTGRRGCRRPACSPGHTSRPTTPRPPVENDLRRPIRCQDGKTGRGTANGYRNTDYSLVRELIHWMGLLVVFENLLLLKTLPVVNGGTNGV